MKWTSPVRRRVTLGEDDSLDDAVMIDDELLPTPAKAGYKYPRGRRRERVRRPRV